MGRLWVYDVKRLLFAAQGDVEMIENVSTKKKHSIENCNGAHSLDGESINLQCNQIEQVGGRSSIVTGDYCHISAFKTECGHLCLRDARKVSGCINLQFALTHHSARWHMIDWFRILYLVQENRSVAKLLIDAVEQCLFVTVNAHKLTLAKTNEFIIMNLDQFVFHCKVSRTVSFCLCEFAFAMALIVPPSEKVLI